MTDEYKKNWPLSDEFLIELGRLSALWGSLEGALNFAIGKLAGFSDLEDPIPFILVVHSSFQQRLDILGSLCEQRLPDYPRLKNYKDVTSKIKAAQTLRNKFTHNSISPDEDFKKYFLVSGSARSSLKTSVKEVNTIEIHNACREIHIASLLLHELVTGKKYEPIWDRS
jgi:hypothetical protein